MTQGWICVHRKLLEWEWFDDHNTFRLFMYLMLKANHQDTRWKGIPIKRGQHLTSLDKLEANTGLSKSKIRTALKKLISTKEIAQHSNAQHTVITILNYHLYQLDSTPNDTRVTHESHTNDTRIASNNNDNTEKNENINGVPSKKPSKPKKNKATTFPDNFTITESMLDWFNEKNFTIDIERATDKWVDAMVAKGSTYVNWTAAWRTGMSNAEEWSKGK